jgi:hypothetical protein
VEVETELKAIPNTELIDEFGAEGKTTRVDQTLGRDLAVEIQSALELLVEVFDGTRNGVDERPCARAHLGRSADRRPFIIAAGSACKPPSMVRRLRNVCISAVGSESTLNNSGTVCRCCTIMIVCGGLQAITKAYRNSRSRYVASRSRFHCFAPASSAQVIYTAAGDVALCIHTRIVNPALVQQRGDMTTNTALYNERFAQLCTR